MKEETKKIIRLAASGVLFALGLILDKTVGLGYYSLLFYIPAYLIAGYDVLWRAVKNLVRGRALDENLLMTVATVGAFAVGDFPEGAAVMLFYQVGELFNDMAVEKSRRSISSVLSMRPDSACVLRADGTEETVDPYDVKQGDIIIVRVGERIPLDGEVIEGRCVLDTSALTGESVPREVEMGQQAASGCINLHSVIKLRVTGDFEGSTVNRILELVESASNKKTRTENFITKFAKYYTPAVVGLAAALAIIPPIIDGNWSQWIHRGLTFLVVSCPCALVISVPLAFFSGLGAAAKKGVMIKGGNYMDVLSHLQTVAFDKTGTLTEGRFRVSETETYGVSREELLRLAAGAEYYSTHPIARSIVESCPDAPVPQSVEEQAGGGVAAVVEGSSIAVGSAALMAAKGVKELPQGKPGAVFVAKDGKLIGSIIVSDNPKKDSAEAVAELKKMGVKTVMLTGDNEHTARKVANDLGVDEEYSQLLPQDKVARLEELLEERRNGGTVAFVGDGINDAPVLARADVGVAMGQLGSDAAIEAADVVLMNDSLSRLPDAVRLSRKTMRIAWQNIVLSLLVKAAVLVLSALGIAGMWLAVFADVGVAMLAVLNSMRAMRG